MGGFNQNNSSVDAVYSRYADQLYRLAFTQLSSQQDAEDAVADVFVKYLASPPDFRDENHEKAWFIRVLINRCRDMQRRKSVRAYTPLDEVIGDIAAPEQSKQLLEQVRTLPEKYRTAILLHYFEGFSLEETATILHCTVSAVKMRLLRGRNELRTTLKGD